MSNAPTAREPFTAEQFVETMRSIEDAFRPFALYAMAIPAEHVTRALETVNRADAVGWVVDPTRYRDALGDGRLERQRKLLELYRHTTAGLRELFPKDWEGR